MKRITLLIALSMATAGVAWAKTPPPPTAQPGEPVRVAYAHDTCETAVSFDAPSHTEGVRKEYIWVKNNLPEHRVVQQKLIQCDAGPADVLVLFNEKANQYLFVVFDLSRFWGKGFEELR
jgi:hypothetical protein